MAASMLTVDGVSIRAPVEGVFQVAADTERWPEVLPHYRWVRFLGRQPSGGVVEMAAWRPFGPVRYPTWWVSRMTIDRPAREIRYNHLRGITRGMDVVWRLAARDGSGEAGAEVAVEHRWAGLPWPLVGGAVGRLVIRPRFVPGLASRPPGGGQRAGEKPLRRRGG